MAALNTKPGSSTTAQRKRLIALGRSAGQSVDDLREIAGGSLRQLSAAQASALITRLGGGDLPNEPGKAPRPYGRRTTDATRMIHTDHVEQIERLLIECFDDPARGAAWLRKNFKVDEVRQLATAQRAGEVIATLKRMIQRTRDPSPERKRRGDQSRDREGAVDPSPKRQRGGSQPQRTQRKAEDMHHSDTKNTEV